MPDLTVADLASHYQIDVQTVQGYIRAGRFPDAYKLGRSWRIPETSRDALRPQPFTGLAPRNNRSRAQQRNNR